MRWTRLTLITVIGCTIGITSAFLKKSVALSLCSILTFNSVTCPAYWGDTSRANAAVPIRHDEIEQALTDRSEEQEVADICLFGICAPVNLPDPIEDVIEGGLNEAAEDQLRSLFAEEIPIRGSNHEFYDSVAALPGEVFEPQLLPLNALSPDMPIPPGDYEIPAHFYCTKIYSFDGRGNRFALARLDGRMSDVLSALYTRASYDLDVSTNDVQMLSWAIQTGMAYNELSDSQRALVDQLIPNYRNKMESSLVDRLTGIANDVSRISGNRLPGVNQILDDLGPVGDIAGSLLQGREQILQSNYSYQALAQEFAPQEDTLLEGGTEETPWSRTRENVYMRFIAPNGAMDDGIVQVRILANRVSMLSSKDRDPSSTTFDLVAKDLTQDITQSVGIPEASGAQAITASLPPKSSDPRYNLELACSNSDNSAGLSNVELFETSLAVSNKDAIPIVFPDYLIGVGGNRVPGLGHAGILLINPVNGLTRYYEYGRYDQAQMGLVRSISVPNVVMGSNGRPTEESLNRVLGAISRLAGQGGRISGVYIDNDNFEQMERYAQERLGQNNNPRRESYKLSTNNCGHFMQDVLEAGGVNTPFYIDPRPNSYIEELRGQFPGDIIDFPRR
jgi:hypothetical protein